MTLDDLIARESIRHALAFHNHAGDNGDSDGWASTFTEDATLEALGFSLSGRDALHKWKSGNTVFAAASYRSHHVSGIVIDLGTPDVADVQSNWLVTTEIGADHGGRYTDKFRKVGDDWCIAHRRIDILWRAADSLIGEDKLLRR